MILVIMCGLPGSGKSTAAVKVCKAIGGVRLSTDDRFIVDGVYKFDPAKLGEYHERTYEEALSLFEAGTPVVLDNTNTQRWHYDRYVHAAWAAGYQVVQYALYDGRCVDELLASRNVHGVPLVGIQRQRESWEDDRTLVCVRNMFEGKS